MSRKKAKPIAFFTDCIVITIVDNGPRQLHLRQRYILYIPVKRKKLSNMFFVRERRNTFTSPQEGHFLYDGSRRRIIFVCFTAILFAC
ncbi:MAG: hypothetical protein LWX56_00570 [Ignavibacteria bacterium]|nr:hypothetical protein [Ignavibacteria bacterium]